MACAADDVAVGMAEAFGGGADGGDAALIELDRIKAADFLHFNVEAHLVADFLCALGETPLHVFDHCQLWRAEIDGEDDFAGDDIARVRVDVDMTRRADRVGFVRPCDLVDQF